MFLYCRRMLSRIIMEQYRFALFQLIFICCQQEIEGLLFCYAEWDIYGPPSLAVSCDHADHVCMTTECAPPSGGSIYVRGCAANTSSDQQVIALCEHMVGSWVATEYCWTNFCNKQAKNRTLLPLAFLTIALILILLAPLCRLLYQLGRWFQKKVFPFSASGNVIRKIEVVDV